MTNLLIGLALVACLALVVWQAIGFAIAWKLLYSDHHSFPNRRTPGDVGIDYQMLSIPVDGSHQLAAWLLSPRPDKSLGGACIIMVHGYNSAKDKVWAFPDDQGYQACTLDQGASALWEAGFFVLAMDLRNHGDSDDNGPVTLGARESDDVLAVVDFLTRNAVRLGIDPTRIGLRGESMGGATCLIAAARDEQNQIAAVWTDSTFANAGTAILDFMRYKGITVAFGPPARAWLVWLAGISIEKASPASYADQIHCPVYLVHSLGDTMLSEWHLNALADAPGWSQPPTTWLLESHQHNRLWREPDYHQRQTGFFQRHLAQPHPQRQADAA